MGNKPGKLEERKESKKKKSKGKDQTSQDTGDSGVTKIPIGRYNQANRSGGGGDVDVKVLRSYSSSRSEAGTPVMQNQPNNFYRRTPSSGPTGGRYQSLPRNVGRSRSTTSGIYGSSNTLLGDGGDHVPFKRYSAISSTARLNDTRDSIRSTSTYASGTLYRGRGGPPNAFSGQSNGQRPSTAPHRPSTASAPPPRMNDTRESIRSTSTIGSYASGAPYRVIVDDFPDDAAIKRRLSQFKTQFAKLFVAFYTQLPENVQLAAVTIALRIDTTGQHPLSLFQYLNSDDIPEDLEELNDSRSPQSSQYQLTIPLSLFHGVRHIRTQRSQDRRSWTSLARELVTCLAVEVADEIARIFEYQIVMVGDGTPIDLLARYAVDSAMDYLKSGNRFLERNSLIAGVLRGRRGDPSSSRIISVVVGERELKWNLADIFQKCGLRMERMLFSSRLQDSGHNRPWVFYNGPDCNPRLYGYRGQVLEKDPVHGFYAVSRDDEFHFTQEMGWNPDDIHQKYLPFHRLIGKEVMDEFCRVTKDADNLTLSDFVKRLQGYEYQRDQIQPIYCPLGMVSAAAPYRSRMGSSVSSLISTDSVFNRRSVAGQHSSRIIGVPVLPTNFPPGVKQIHVNSTVIVQNRASSPPQNGFDRGQGYPPQPVTGVRALRSFDSCSTASGDAGYERTGRDASTGGGNRFRNSATFTHRQPMHQGRLYQSQRQPTRSVSGASTPISGPVVAREVSPPLKTATGGPRGDFLDFNAFLGMVKGSEGEKGASSPDGVKVNGRSSPVARRRLVSSQSDSGILESHSRMASSNGAEHSETSSPIYRGTAISHV